MIVCKNLENSLYSDIARQKHHIHFCNYVELLRISNTLKNYQMKVDSESTFKNDVLKKSLTKIFFDLEKTLNNNDRCSSKAPSLSSLLRTNSLFSVEAISKIIKLRNCWYHGYFIGDVVENSGDDFVFTLKFTLEILKEITEIARKDVRKFRQISKDINNFVQSFLNYYVLRMVELSYKILDKRLLTIDKLESRLNNMDSAFKRFENVDSNFFEMLADLLSINKVRWRVARAKFLDNVTRDFYCENLKIAKLHSKNGFKIGSFQTDRKDIVLALVDLEERFENLVNGISLKNMQCVFEKKYSKLIKLVNIEL